MKTQPQINEALCEILGNSDRVYFQPKPTVKLQYPAIVYSVEGMPTMSADNKNYIVLTRYKVTIIEQKPNTGRAERLLSAFPSAKHTGSFITDGLYHNVFTVLNN